jgi:protein-L-isoaspartate(D-aspartate) O-methyltransferase
MEPQADTQTTARDPTPEGSCLVTHVATPQPAASQLRAHLADALIADGALTSPTVEAAIRAVPREVFTPAGTDLEMAYTNNIVVTKRDPAGTVLSSISAPWLQTYMLETAQLEPGSRVLEIGSGGYNAALIAEVVGPTGAVTSIDIDADVVTNARAALARAGYAQVHVALADAEYGYPASGPYDAIIVTVEAGDIPPAWPRQLAPGGLLVVPLRMRGNTRCLTLEDRGDHLAAIAALQCGFVAMQGDGSSPVRRAPLRGDDVVLVLDDVTEANADALASALDLPRVEAWAPVTVTMDEPGSFESLHLWLASQARPCGVLAVNRERAAGLVDPQDKFVCPTLLSTDSLAYLSLGRLDDTTWRFGAHGFGPDATALVGDLVDLIVAWDAHHRRGPGPEITVHPVGTVLQETNQTRLLVRRRHALIAITWPDAGQP